jgi:hypothetical protein
LPNDIQNPSLAISDILINNPIYNMNKTAKSTDKSEPRIAYEAPKMEAIQIEIENVLLDSTSLDSYGANDGSYYGRG